MFDPGLPDLTVTRSYETPEKITVNGDIQGDRPAPWRRHGWRRLRVLDIPHGGRQVELVLRLPRFINRGEGRVEQQRADWLEPGQRLTTRLAEYVLKEWPTRKSSRLASLTGLSDKTISRIVAQAENLPSKPHGTPVHLGLDECHIAGSARAVLCDLDTRRLVDIAAGQTQAHVVEMLRRLRDPKRVTTVVIDCTPRYAAAVRQALGASVSIVLDRWHVEKLVRDAFEGALRDREASLRASGSTKRLRASLRVDRGILKKPVNKLSVRERRLVEAILDADPNLEAHWQACQDFCAIFDLRSRGDAEAAYSVWWASLDNPTRATYGGVHRTIEKWHTEVFGYFQDRHTNGPTESLNRRLKEVSRLANQQLSFERFRYRALCALGQSVAPPTNAPPHQGTTSPRRVATAPAGQMSLFEGL